MKDLESNLLKEHKNAVKSWWNLKHQKEKWHGHTYKHEYERHSHYLVRQTKTLKLLDSLNLKKGSRVLELGFGGAETGREILKRGFVYYGIDISNHLVENAKKDFFHEIKKEKAFFSLGSLEDKFEFGDNFFEVVIICGAIHYSGNISNNFSEVKRVLKEDGHYIIGQGNMYTLNDLIHFRKFLKCLIWYFSDQKYIESYSLSFKDMIFETKLKKYFFKFKENKFMNSNFMTNKSDKWKYKIRKRIFSFSTLKETINQHGFDVVKYEGGPFLCSSVGKKNFIKKIFNSILSNLLDKKIFPFLIRIADNCIFLSKPKN